METEDWDGINRIIEGTGPDHQPDPREASDAIKAMIDLGKERGLSSEYMDGKLSVMSKQIAGAVIKYLESLALKKMLASLFGAGGASEHMATEETCRQCDEPECDIRKAPYQAANIPIQ
jgi:hypothetical protein